MNIEFFKSAELSINAKATIHATTGKLGFNRNAEKLLNLTDNKYVKIGRSSDYKDKSLFIIPLNNNDLHSFSILKSGAYYYANTARLFHHLGIDYKNIKVIYDITEINIDGQKMFKLEYREIERN